MKAINKFFYALLAFATVGMVACSEDATHEPGPAELEGCYGVYFPEVSVLESQGPMGETSLDPSEATVFKYYAYRENTEGEITVPVEINSTLDAEEKPMYTVEPIVFADGEDVAEFTVTLSDKAEVGVPYKLTVSVVNDPQYVKQYDTANATMFSVTINRVKWIDVGYITDEQGGVWCEYSEDMVAAWYGFQQPLVYPVKVQVRADSVPNEEKFLAALEGNGTEEDLIGIYRVINAYYPFAEVDGFTPYETSFNIYVDGVDRVHIPLQPVGLTVNDGAGIGDVMIYSMVHYYLDNGAEPYETDYGSIRGGKITFPVKALLGCPGGSYAGSNTYYVNTNGLWSLNIAPAFGSYELNMPDAEEDGDFSFAEVELPEGAMFYSESQATASAPVLEKGRCEVNTKDADRIFYKEYGVLYRLPDLYAGGYPIYFAALEDGTVTLPTAYLNQATGLVQNGFDVLMAIDAEQSKFDPATGLMTLVAEFYSGSGEDAVSYGTFKEVIAVDAPEFPVQPVADLKNDFSYSAFYTAPMTSEFMDSEFDVDVEQGTCINPYLELDGTAYRMPSLYTNGYDIYFVADSEGNVGVTAGYELQPTGVVIYGKAAYMQILGGTCNEKTVVLNAKFCDVEGNSLVPALCTETVVNYTWVEVATGSYYSSLYTTETEDGQVAYAPFTGRKLFMAEDTNLYRIENYLGEGSELRFTWDKTTNKCEIVGFNDTGVDAANFGGVGNIFACDFRTFYQWLGYDYTWEFLASKLGDVQPYYDPAANEFVFYVQLTAPEMGVGMALGEGYVEYFSIDGAISEGAKWETVATGSWYCNVLNNPITGLTLEHKEGTNSYRVVNFMTPVTGVEGNHFEFTWDQATNLCEVKGLNDTGIVAADLGVNVDGNIFFADEKTTWNTVGYDDTWESLQAEYGVSVQPYYDPTQSAFFFRVSYFLPSVNNMLTFNTSDGQQTRFVDEVFALDAQAAPAAVAAEKVSVAGIKAIGERVGHIKMNNRRTVNSAAKASLNKSSFKAEKTVARSLKTATPVKRQTKVLAF